MAKVKVTDKKLLNLLVSCVSAAVRGEGTGQGYFRMETSFSADDQNARRRLGNLFKASLLSFSFDEQASLAKNKLNFVVSWSD